MKGKKKTSQTENKRRSLNSVHSKSSFFIRISLIFLIILIVGAVFFRSKQSSDAESYNGSVLSNRESVSKNNKLVDFFSYPVWKQFFNNFLKSLITREKRSTLFPKSNLKSLVNEYRNLSAAEKKELRRCVYQELGMDKAQQLLEDVKAKTTPDDYSLKVVGDCINSVKGGGVTKGKEKDITGYSTELVKPASRNPSRWADARCNDGTPFAFRVERPTGKISNDWVIYLQGGGMCDDNGLSCKDRLEGAPKLTTTFPGSDGQKSTIFSNSGIFNHDPKVNQNFYNANKVQASYCSSDLWSGNSASRRKSSADPAGWYFSGRLNVKAMFEMLKEQFGLDDGNQNTRILLTGGSAGCMGANINAETAHTYFPNAAKTGRLKLISDGCFFPDFNHPDYPVGQSGEGTREVFAKAFEFFASSINSYCESDQKNKNESPGSCFLASTLYPYLTNCDGRGLCLPDLIQNSSIDHSLLLHLNINPKPSPDNAGLELVRLQMLKEFSNPQINWLFSGGNISYHTITQRDEMWNYGPDGGPTYGEVVNSFWKGESAKKIIFGNP